MPVPVGTRIVLEVPVAGSDRVHPAGASAVVIAVMGQAGGAAGEDYRIRLADGDECRLDRSAFALLTEAQRRAGMPMAADDAVDLRRFVIYRCIVGSRAYGLDTETSDVDTRGVYLPPAERHWSIYGVPEQLEDRATDEIYWELQKFLQLGLKANPNILEVLFSPIVVDATPLGEELRAMRGRFVSRLVFQTYGGYVMSQFKRLTQRVRAGRELNWKHAMHLVRLLLAGIEVLRTGDVPVRVADAHRDDLLAIRHGRWDLARVDAWRLALQREFEAAYAATRLPERPDVAAVDAFLRRARRAALEWQP